MDVSWDECVGIVKYFTILCISEKDIQINVSKWVNVQKQTPGIMGMTVLICRVPTSDII